MAKCEICGKSVSFGIQVSHSHRRSNKMWKPNVRKVRAIVDGTHKRVYACTRCLRSGKVTRGYGAGVNPEAAIAEIEGIEISASALAEIEALGADAVVIEEATAEPVEEATVDAEEPEKE